MKTHKLHVCIDCSKPHQTFLCRHVMTICTHNQRASVFTREVDCPHCITILAGDRKERPARC